MTPAWRRVAQGATAVALVAAGVVLYRLYQSYTAELHGATIGVSWGEVILSSLVWLAGYLQMIQLWSSSFPWWGSRLPWYKGLRVFLVTNLARYIPGGVWQFAGLAGMTMAAGGSPVAASLGVILLQICTLATGMALTLSAAPRLLGPWAATLNATEQLVIAVVLIAVLVIAFPRLLPRIRRVAERVLKRPVPLPTPPRRAFAIYVIRCAANWLIYGFAFWLFSRALLGPSRSPSVWVAITSYVASYLVGLLAVFAPGGIVVREGAIVALLTPSIGYQAAVILALASRLWQVAIEVAAACIALAADWVIRTRIKAMSRTASASQK
jgi:glycosyltransferase 2 family protein